jgi:maleate isomerase
MTTQHHVGLLIPSSNTTIEYEYNRFAPAEITWHVGRLTLTEVSPKGVADQEPDIVKESAKLATAHPDFLLLCQSAIGFVGGAGYEAATLARMRAASGIAPLSAARLMVAAIRALGARRIALATPFASAVDDAAAAYFTSAGFPPVLGAALGMTGNYGIAAVTADRLIQLARCADGPDIDTIVIPGGNLRAMALLPEIEAALGKPVVITNQACIWAVAGLLGLPVGPAFGRLAMADPDRSIRLGLLA